MRPPTATCSPDRSLHILLVEDDLSTARALRRLLSMHGFTVHLAGSVANAAAVATRQPLDLLICDLQLPDGSGYDIPDRVRDVRAETPAIVLSALGDPDDRARSAARNFAAHLVKPVDELVLVATIRRVLEEAARATANGADRSEG